jgi:hypothetical protein
VYVGSRVLVVNNVMRKLVSERQAVHSALWIELNPTIVVRGPVAANFVDADLDLWHVVDSTELASVSPNELQRQPMPAMTAQLGIFHPIELLFLRV